MLNSLPLRLTALERKLGLRFKDRELLGQALVHASYMNEVRPGDRPAASYERLEFLGDAVLGLAITLELFRKRPLLDEGQLTKLRSSLVRGTTLAGVARRLELGQDLKLGRGEESTGGRDRESNLAAAFESLVGAAFLDRGFDEARKLVLRLMAPEMEDILAQGVREDPKSRLQEQVQAMGGALPQYRTVEADIADSDGGFEAEVVMDGQVVARGQGKRKAEAEKQAAHNALRQLETSGEV